MMHKRLRQLGSSIFTKLLAITIGTVVIMTVALAAVFFSIVRPLALSVSPVQQAQLQAAHDRMLAVFLVLLVVIMFAGHTAIRRMLAPVRWLQQGIEALREGDLAVVVPHRTNDELGSLTQAFNQMVGRVGEMVRARDQLLLDVSHELRSPLTRMKVALALCAGDEHTQRLSANIDEMERLVSELLELERLRQGRTLQLEQHDLMEIVRDAVTTFADMAPGVNIETAPDRLLLPLDADKIRTVLGNLLENASKYALPDSMPARVAVAQDGATVRVQVTDDGPGVPQADLANLFEPFYRVDRSRSKRTGGYGLGLSLCKRIMEAHGGAIEVRNNPGRGTTFAMSFSMTPAISRD